MANLLELGTFVVQFVLLSFIFGVPLICFHGCIGQYLGSNVIDMWRISPIFKVKISLNHMTSDAIK